MKKLLSIVVLSLLFTGISNGTGLKFLSKKDAKKAIKVIEKEKYLYFFCGCCTSSEKELVEVVSAEMKELDKDHYEIILTYKTESGEQKSKELDLSNVWMKGKKFNQTIGQELELKHDTCEPLGKVEWPK